MASRLWGGAGHISNPCYQFSVVLTKGHLRNPKVLLQSLSSIPEYGLGPSSAVLITWAMLSRMTTEERLSNLVGIGKRVSQPPCRKMYKANGYETIMFGRVTHKLDAALKAGALSCLCHSHSVTSSSVVL